MQHDMAGHRIEWAMFAPVLLYYLYYVDFTGLGLLVCCLLIQNRSALLDGGEFSGLLINYQKIICTILCIILVVSSLRLYQSICHSQCLPKWNGVAGPLMFPCQTAHARMFPEKHSFTYSYLMVGIPVDWEGNSAGMISAGMESRPNFKQALYNIDPGDYLEPGSREIGLRAKLDKYLRTQDVPPSRYPYAYLATAAKFMGYSSNPASFWYLYSSDKILSAMIVEVNNTFDEKRLYFLPRRAGAQLEDGESVGEASRQMKNSWQKDFHVSPFNSRKGSYSLVADDPFTRSTAAGKGPINATITLRSSKGRAKLVARVFSDGPPIDPTLMSRWQKLKFILCWWWVGLATIPRTVKQAGILFFSKRLHVWYRPEPFKTTISCRATEVELKAERFFRIYLRHLVDTAPTRLLVKYTAAGLNKDAYEEMISPNAKTGDEPPKRLEFKVLTPIFYTRFLHYAHNMEGLCREHELDGTIWLSDLSIIPELVMRPQRACHVRDPYQDGYYLYLSQYMRAPPEPIERPLTSSATRKRPLAEADIRKFRNSPMDAYFIEQDNNDIRAAYKQLVLKVLFCDGWIFGRLLTYMVNSRILVAWVLSAAVNPLFKAKALP